MSFVDKAKDAAEKFKNSDNEQVNKVKDQINEYTGGENTIIKTKKMTNKALRQIGLMSQILRLSNLRLFNLFVVEANSREVIIIRLRKLS